MISSPQANQKLSLAYRFLPFLFIVLLIVITVVMWPSDNQYGSTTLSWLNIILLMLFAVVVFVVAIRARNERRQKAGAMLRSKLVVAMVVMVLVPTVVLQFTANQVIEKGMDVWFDVRVDTLLEKAMGLSQSFYARIATHMDTSLIQVAQDLEFSQGVVSAPIGTMTVSYQLRRLLDKFAWDKAELFDIHERVIALAQRTDAKQKLDALRQMPVSESGRLSILLGRQTTEHEVREDGEYVVGYMPIFEQRRYVALLRAQVRLPESVVSSARSIEADYRSYRELERHRQGIKELFMHTLMMVTILMTSIAGLFAMFFARRLITPVEDLAVALKKVESGEFDGFVPVRSDDELGSLVVSFNSMTERLKFNMEALKQTQDELTSALVSSRQRQYVLENLLAKLQSGVILLDDDGSIRLMNLACKQLFAITSIDKRKTSILDFSEAHLKPVLDFYQTLHTQQLNSLQSEMAITRGIQSLQVLARGGKLGEADGGTFTGWLLVFDDVTQLAEAQKHQAWSEVAQRLAHEIKNPLTPIKLSTERLQRRFRNQVDNIEVFDTCTLAVINQVERLQRLLADFSNLATLPKPKCEQIAIAALIKDMSELYSPYDHVTFEGRPSGTVYCDADQIRQVLINLIDNALATEKPVRVFVEISDEWNSFYVQDEGLGIDENTRKHMFDPYFSTKKDGSGLGLAIAQRISEEHGGQLQLVSTSSTRFCMRLPHVYANQIEEAKT